jgi:hypothetical protein
MMGELAVCRKCCLKVLLQPISCLAVIPGCGVYTEGQAESAAPYPKACKTHLVTDYPLLEEAFLHQIASGSSPAKLSDHPGM